MQYHWLNKQNNNNLIIFFAGWSFDFKPFEFLDCGCYDVLFVYDYNTIDDFNCEFSSEYSKKILITWSMGVFAAFLLKNSLPELDKKISINGTPFPVNDTYGIPQKPFLLTLRHAKTGLEGKFYQNIFDNGDEYRKYLTTPVERTIENRESELKALYEKIKSTDLEYDGFYDFALISSNDKIIPSKNQLNFWKNNAPYKLLESGHFPFYNFKSWDEIIQAVR